MQSRIREAFGRSLRHGSGRRGLSLSALCCLGLATSALAQSEPAAISSDPPVDPAHPASGQGLQFISHGELVNAMLYLPAGAEPHPAIILLHGLPGNEQNLDLARAMQRAGWAVITFHYRGSWGSAGKFTLSGGCDDVGALLREIEGLGGPAKWHVDPRRMVVVGHSYGGFVASCAARCHPELSAIGLIAPWDISYDAREFSKLSPKEVDARAGSVFSDVDGRLEGATALSLMHVIRAEGTNLRLTDVAPALGERPLLLAAATRDDPDDQAGDLRSALEKNHSAHLTFRLFETDHGFDDQRIALTSYVLEWLATLPIAPKPN
jgi:pimeloyl-ACP methyl ester carboxylesterase